MRLKKLNIDVARINKLPVTVPLSPAIVEKYRDQISQGQTIEPLLACFDGQSYWLFDGYHRLEALGQCCCIVAVYRGTQDDALRRFIREKLRIKGKGGIKIFRHCISEIHTHWSNLDNKKLTKLFGRSPIFYDNIRHFLGTKSDGTRRFFRINKHGTIDLMRSCGPRSDH